MAIAPPKPIMDGNYIAAAAAIGVAIISTAIPAMLKSTGATAERAETSAVKRWELAMKVYEDLTDRLRGEIDGLNTDLRECRSELRTCRSESKELLRRVDDLEREIGRLRPSA